MPNADQGNAGKWQFWPSLRGANWGDRGAWKAHATVGRVWAALALYGLYRLAARVF